MSKRKFFWIILLTLLLFLVVVGGYVFLVFFAYERLSQRMGFKIFLPKEEVEGGTAGPIGGEDKAGDFKISFFA